MVSHCLEDDGLVAETDDEDDDQDHSKTDEDGAGEDERACKRLLGTISLLEITINLFCVDLNVVLLAIDSEVDRRSSKGRVGAGLDSAVEATEGVLRCTPDQG